MGIEGVTFRAWAAFCSFQFLRVWVTHTYICMDITTTSEIP
jgi:hypothetical protein